MGGFDKLTTGTLSVVATPIGNLGDITIRALEVLKEADVIACEDTRVTSKLLARYGIRKPLVVFHARSGVSSGNRVLHLLEEGKRVALVTDAGTPGVSDPGVELVARARGAGARIEAIAGASALAASLSVAGLPCSEFIFFGFLPHKKGRQTLFGEIASLSRTAVLYESPHRIMKTLQTLAARMPNRQVAVCRELTKLHEEIVVGSAVEVLENFRARPAAVRGEFVVVVAP